MVSVEPVPGLTYYMDNKLAIQLETKVKAALHKNDEDYVLVVDGYEGAGKSTMAMQVGKFIDPTLNLSRICFTPDEFRKAILGASKGQCIIFDEAFRGFGASSALSEVNKILKSLMIEMRQKNLFIIIVLPTFYLLEKYVALWRTKCLIHVHKSGGRRGYFKLYNKRKKQMMYLNPIGKKYYSYSHVKTKFRGRFYGKYVIDEQKYRKKKEKSFKDGYNTTKKEKYMDQRNAMVDIVKKYTKFTQEEISLELKKYGITLQRSTIKDILAKYRVRGG